MNNNIQCSIESSTTKIELNSAVDGVFLVPELEGLVGLPEIRTTSGVNAGYDGGWTSAQNYDARLISIRGVIANPDISKVEDKRRAIASLLGQGRKEQLTLRFTTEAGNAYAISVRTISCEMALQRVLTTQEFLIQLRADDPLIYDDGTTGGIAAILQPQRALGGFEINFGLPLAIGGGAEDTVVDNGNETVYPVIKLYGALHSPTVVNRTTNQQMQILADLQYSIDWHTYRSATGDYILVSDGLNGAPMTLSQLTGNAEQTTYSGKNLFNFDKFISDNVSVQGVTRGTATYTSNSITLTATSNDCFTKYNFPTNLYPVITVSQNTDVTLSWKTNNTSGTNKGVVYVFGNNNGAATVIINAQDRAEHCTFNTGSYTEISFRVGVANSGDTLTYSDIQVEIGSAPTAYEKFVGGTVSPNPDYPQDINVVTGGNTVVIYGKNSLSAPQDYTEDRDGLVFTCTDGVYNISGNASSGNVTADHDIIQPYTIRDGDYWHLCNDFTETHIQIALVFTDGSIRNYSPGNVVNRIESLSAYVGKTVSKIRFYYNPRYNINGNIKPMILNGVSTATDFIPYQGQSYEINLGGNLFDRANATENKVLTWATGTLNDEDKAIISDYISASGGQQFSTKYIAYIFCYDSSKTYLGTIQTGGTTIAKSGGGIFSTFTIPSGYSVAYIRVELRSSANSNLDMTQQDIMLNYGSTALPYTPYTTYAYELAKVGNYQDRIYKDDGKWYIEKQVGKTVITTENASSWLLNSTSYAVPMGYCSKVSLGGKTGWATGVAITNRYSEITSIPQITSGKFGTNFQQPNFIIFDSSFTDTATMRTNLVGTEIYIALATPTTTEITDETLLLQLNFLASLYKGANNISLVGTGAQGEMTVRYATDYTVNQDIITIDSQARTITLNGQDVYHLKTSESEFLVLAPGENKLYLTSEVSDDSGYAEVKFKQGYLSI